MPFRNVRQWPDEILKSVASSASTEDIKLISQDLIDTLKVVNGAGLAAPQVGISKSVFVIDVSKFEIKNPDDNDDSPFLIIANPKILKFSEEIKWREACLSVPYSSSLVSRFKFITVEYDDIEGERKILNLFPPLSLAFQHENDHLVGKTILDRISKLSSSIIKRKIRKQSLKIERNDNLLEDGAKQKIGKNSKKNNLSVKEIKKRKINKKNNFKKK